MNPYSGETLIRNRGDDNDVGADGKEFLTFMLGTEEYGVEILKVQEIRRYDHMTRVPGAPEFIKGLSNLRGLIVPIVDLRIKFLLGIPTYDRLTTVIILNINNRLVGIVVSSVSDVITLVPRQIQSFQNSSINLKSECLIGLGSIGERMIILVNADRLMTSSEMDLMDQVDETLG